ncbi:DNA polymerase III subunit alpha [Hyphomicrobium sp.]|uniref:DNA polymerase III subunit alpha n=1 Tax=Hyphomicrobium sp. TaxID=82 RepID=UPI0025BEBDAE|nr:DNA polymerase III subunit alpha [Hyphomicrobium sp.]MCC7252301.1 DNA polymerase III subunit alpha [Hyphomicrobium sp.]
MTATPTLPKYVHLKTHSAYSLLEGALPISKIAKLAEAAGMPAIGLTDTNNLFGALEFSEKLAGAGIQPIVGGVFATDFADGAAASEPNGSARHGQNAQPVRPAGALALLASSAAGYANLIKLASQAFLLPDPAEPTHIKLDALEDHRDGLIVLTGGPEGPISRALAEGQTDLARERLERLQRVFNGNLYVELQRHGLKSEEEIEPQLIALAYDLGIPLVATNEVYFASPDDYEAHDALLCIAEGRMVTEDNRRRVSREHYFKSAEDMASLFADLPEALESTIEIAQRCAYRPLPRKPILPRFVSAENAPNGDQSAAEELELKRQAEEGLAARLAANELAPGFAGEDYAKRLAYELDVIARMKFPGYFLIVSDFIKWAKAHGIPVGPGRGSGAGSVVAWSLTITDLDPLRFGLLFERFLNPERISMPDFDIDFCQDRRDEVIRYVQGKYGHDRVAQIITHGKLQARAVLRDVGRVLQMPYGQVDRLCKLVPNNPANPVTLPEAIDGEPKLQEERDADPLVARLLEIGQKLEGLYRHASTHAAGMVIGDRPLDELVPLYRDPKSSMPVTQFNWKMVEAAGLVKFDFLGLKTLTVLTKAVELVKRGRGIDIDLLALPLDDKPSYDLLAKADTAGVFQLESTGMRESLKRLKPDRFEDIIAMVALYRPGPMDNIPTYINRKHGEEPVDCLHTLLESILKETYGVIIYQEQVMQIAQVMAGYSLGEADLLRRAMGKKDKNEMAKQQARFVEGAMKNGVRKDDAVYIFELVDKFAGYGFNKSHAAAYALVSYHTAYMKANFREEFLAASMTLDAGNTDKLAMFAAEAKKSGIRVLPPCVNESAVEFLAVPPASPSLRLRGEGSERSSAPPRREGQRHTAATASAPHSSPLPASGEREPEPRGAIRYALAALKNIGASAVETIVESRNQKGPYTSLADFAARINTKAVNKRALETLSAAGAFDALERNRALVYANADQMMREAGLKAEDDDKGQWDMLGKMEEAAAPVVLKLKPTEAWTPMEKLQKEFDAVGFFLSGHPLDQYEKALAKLNVRRFVDFEAASARGGATAGRLAGIVIAARERRSQKGNKFAFALFSDTSGQFEAVIFSDTLAKSRQLLETGTAVLLDIEGERDGDALKMRVQDVQSLDDAVRQIPTSVRILLDGEALGRNPASLDQLKALLNPGKAEATIELRLADYVRPVPIAPKGKFDLSARTIGRITTLPGVIEVIET